MIIRQTWLLCASFAMTTVACKPKPTSSSEKSLENFASQSLLKENSCNGKAAAKKSGTVNAIVAGIKGIRNTALENAVRDAAAAVPENLRDAFVALNGEIILASDTDFYCRPSDTALNVGGNESKYEYSACYRYRPASAEAPRLLQIVMKPTATEIRHGLVRQFGYFYSERFRFFDFSVVAGKLVMRSESQANPVVQAQVDAAADAFFFDLYGSPFMGINAMSQVIPQSALEAIAGRVKSKSNQVLNGVGLSSAKVEQLKNAIFAEGFDSYYCSAHESFAVEPFKEISTGKNFSAEKLKSVLSNVHNSRVIMGFLFNQSLRVFDNADHLVFGGAQRPSGTKLALTCGNFSDPQVSLLDTNFGGLVSAGTQAAAPLDNSLAGADFSSAFTGLSGLSTAVEPSTETYDGTMGAGFKSLASSVETPSTDLGAFTEPLSVSNMYAGQMEPAVGSILSSTAPSELLVSDVGSSAARETFNSPEVSNVTEPTTSLDSGTDVSGLALNGPSNAAKCAVEAVTGVVRKDSDDIVQTFGRAAANSIPDVNQAVKSGATLGDALNAAPPAAGLTRPGKIEGSVGGITPAKAAPRPEPHFIALDKPTADALDDVRFRNTYDEYYKLDKSSVAVSSSKTDRVANIDAARRAAERINEINRQMSENSKMRYNPSVSRERALQVQPIENRLVYQKQRLIYELQQSFPRNHPHYEDVYQAFANRTRR